MHNDTQKGKVHGTGDDAVYTFGLLSTVTNGNLSINELRLTGNPAMLSNSNGTFQNHIVIWDRAKDKLTLPGGDYKIQGSAKTAGTNKFLLPKTKLTK